MIQSVVFLGWVDDSVMKKYGLMNLFWNLCNHSLPLFLSFCVICSFVDIIEGKDKKVLSDKTSVLDKDRY